jgi:outer membrane protein assembly factor BamB
VADFSLSTSPASVSIVGGSAGAQVSVLASAINSFSGTVSVAISGLPSGVKANPATLQLTPGSAQSTTLTASIGAAAATVTVTLTGASGGLAHSSSIALTVKAAAMTNAPDVTTYHDDIARDGLNAEETILTLSNVNSAQFGKIGFDTVDGLVDAEPLYLANVIVGGGLHSVLYVATEHGSLYAFDADNGAQLWKVSLVGSGETTSDDRGCGQVSPEIGITSTPAIDRRQGVNGTLFTVGMTKDASGSYHQRLHALDITTGAEIGGSPTEITAIYPGTGASASGGNVLFEPGQYKERAALLLLNDNVYLGFSSHCDIRPYTGWVMGYSESTLQQTQVLNLTPNGSEGSIWMSGDGMAADSSGNLYFLDANGSFDTTLDASGFPANGDFGNAMLKVSTSGALAVEDYFETYNTVTESDEDEDLGSGGEVLLPDETDAASVVRHLIVGAGKDSNIYLADRDNMGKFEAGIVTDPNIYQEVMGALAGQVFATPAFFNGVLYYGAVGDALKAFPMTDAKLATTPSSRSSTSFPYPGTTPSISANGTQDGIVWALESSMSAPGVLHAYDTANLTHELYNTGQAAGGRDSFGNGNKFITPLIVNGKVYVGTQTGVAVFGLLEQ